MSEGSVADRTRPVLSRAAAHLISLQHGEGCWEGEVVWCTMILSQYVIVRHVIGRPVPEESRQDIVRHYAATRTPEGGWPLHPEGPAQIFTTTLAYVALRLLGVAVDDELTRGARDWLHRQPGGILGIPTWGKFWLCMLDLYAADGVDTFPPELFLLPPWVPGHPRTWYCHTRYIYLGMSYLAARGFTANLGPLRDALRAELYEQPYETIVFAAHRYHVSPTDQYARPAFVLRTMRRVAAALCGVMPTRLRDEALRQCFGRILYEQRASRYQALSPVNGLLNCLAIHATDPSNPALEASVAGLEAWRWSDDERGIRFAGARSRVWDTAFATRALLACSVAGGQLPAERSVRRAHAYLTRSQLAEDLPSDGGDDRDSIRGGWCFSDTAHRWPVSDCTAEALTALLEAEALPGAVHERDRLANEDVRRAVEFLINRQNADGGFSTYEAIRAGEWLQRLNPSEMFRDCMAERSYVECTASAVEALSAVRRVHSDLMSETVTRALERGIAFLRGSQRTDGTFPAAWGINATYSIFHVTKALRSAGVGGTDHTLARAAGWLRSVQRVDGGWGEHFSGCLAGKYVEHERSQAVMTSWALLALMDIDPGCDAIGRGIAWLESIQQADGSWPHEAVNGVFFGTAMLEYSLYVSYFPTWAIGRHAARRDAPRPFLIG